MSPAFRSSIKQFEWTLGFTYQLQLVSVLWITRRSVEHQGCLQIQEVIEMDFDHDGDSREESELKGLAARLRMAMIRLSRQARHQDPSPFSIAQLSALATVANQGPLGIGQLAEIEGLPSPAMSRLADRLEQAGLIVRQANPADRRGVHVVATSDGVKLLARRKLAGNAWLANRIACFDTADRAILERAVSLLETLSSDREGSAAESAGNLGDQR